MEYTIPMKQLFKGLTRDTFILTFVSLFSDIATEMLYPILPIFLTTVIKSPANIVGLIEGIATATQFILQGFSGWIADKIQSKKYFAFFGYLLAACSKPLIGLSTTWPQVLGGRFSDRLGTAIRSAPRDALIASSAQEGYKGKAFGLEGIGDNMGAFIGPLLAALFLFALHLNIRTIFLLAFIPGILSAILILFIKEKMYVSTNSLTEKQTVNVHLSIPYWKYLFITGIFGIGNSTNAFLILRARQIGIPLITTILIYACFNLVAALSSFPAGSLSDKIGRKTMIFLAFSIFAVTYVGFALTTNYILLATLFILYGLFSGTYRAVGKAAAVDFVPAIQRASAVGWYSTTVGISGLIASIVAGQLWVTISPQSVFYFGSITAVLGIISLLFLFNRKHD